MPSPLPRRSIGAVVTTIGVAVGIGNIWRFPYMVGKFGGAAFVLLYVAIVAAIGVPALMADCALGRRTRRGPVGAFASAGLPLGRAAGWFFFAVVAAATAYYTAVIGWVLYHAPHQRDGRRDRRVIGRRGHVRGNFQRRINRRSSSSPATVTSCCCVLDHLLSSS